MKLFNWLFKRDKPLGPWERVVACDECDAFYVPSLLSPSIVVCWRCGGELRSIAARIGRKNGKRYFIRRDKK